MDDQNIPVIPVIQNSVIYPTYQVPRNRFHEALAFYQNAFGATVERREVPESSIRMLSYAPIMRRSYLRFNAHYIIRLVEADNILVLPHVSNLVPSIYVDNPQQLVQQALAGGAEIRASEMDGDVALFTIQDPYGFCWVIGSTSLAPNLY